MDFSEFGKVKESCDHSELSESIQIFKNGVKHLRLDCVKCKKFCGYKQQVIDIETYRFPFGKHKGSSLHEVPDNYLDWILKQTWVRDNLRDCIINYRESN